MVELVIKNIFIFYFFLHFLQNLIWLHLRNIFFRICRIFFLQNIIYFYFFLQFVQKYLFFFAALRESTGGALLIDILFGCTCQIPQIFFLQNIFFREIFFFAEYFFSQNIFLFFLCKLQNIFFCICEIFFL